MRNEIAFSESIETMLARSIRDWMETPSVIEPDSTISEIIGVMADKNVYMCSYH